MGDRYWELGTTHVPQKYALTPEDVSIMAALLECKDLLRRIRCATTGYDSGDSEVDAVIEACQVVDSAIAGFVERELMVSWAWHKEDDKDMILIDWGNGGEK